MKMNKKLNVLLFFQIFEKSAKKSILCATLNFCKKLSRTPTHLIFFPVKAESPYFLKKRRLLQMDIMRKLNSRKRRLFFDLGLTGFGLKALFGF